MNNFQNLDVSLKHSGIHSKEIIYQQSTSQLVKESIIRNEGELSNSGAFVVSTGNNTGRASKDKYIVNTPGIGEIWWGDINHKLESTDYENLKDLVTNHLSERRIFVEDLRVGTDILFSLSLRLITPKAWHALFAKNLFLPDNFLNNDCYTIYHAPDCLADPQKYHLRSDVFIVLNFEQHEILIGGTHYAGEVKKAVFTVMNYHMPQKSVLPMHCAANVGNHNDVALYFGLSGTGKTTLSSDPERRLIGDDEHGWSPTGVFNFEGGCYAKTIRLNPDLEPIIWNAVEKFGSVIENVKFTPGTNDIDYNDVSLTENTRGAYPLSYIPNRIVRGAGGHPENIFFLSADAFGVLPPISFLNPNQAIYYFLSGYTSKLGGTEIGLTKSPTPTFSVCFASPFLPLEPIVYAQGLLERINEHKVNVWLVNTGWTGGAYGIGSRIPLPYTRMLIKSAISGDLAKKRRVEDRMFGLEIPISCPGIPERILDPSENWQNKESYLSTSSMLVKEFIQNFVKFEKDLPIVVKNAGPHLSKSA